jgi:hypothetical protein
VSRPLRAAGVLLPGRSLALALALAAPGCFAPPVLLASPRGPLDLSRFPPGTEPVELSVASDVALRGVFVPAAPAPDGRPAPVVLDFLESSGSVLTGARDAAVRASFEVPVSDAPFVEECNADGAPPESSDPMRSIVRRRLSLLPLLGCSALCVDYTGVGASDGERSADNLVRDAHAAWDEALRRAGGDASRVLLRGTSIGSLAVAALLADGVRPGAVILVAPVRSETVTWNGAHAMGEGLLATFFGWLLYDPVDADLLAELRGLAAPLLVVVPTCDDFLRHDERARLLSAVEQAGGTFLVRLSDHINLSVASRDVLAVEGWFLARLPFAPAPAQRLETELAAWRSACARGDGDAAALDPDQPARARLEQQLATQSLAWPGLAAALAVAQPTPAEERDVLDLLAWLPASARSRLDAVALAHLADFEDPAGRLDLDSFGFVRGQAPELAGTSLADVSARLAVAPPTSRRAPTEYAFSSLDPDYVKITVHGDKDDALRSAVAFAMSHGRDAGLAEPDCRRRTLRLVLKAAGLPERVRTATDGEARPEVQADGEWQPLSIPGWTP